MLRIFRRRERGQVIVFAALLAPILLGMTGMAIDIGRVATSRRHTQNAADAAALAGAGKLLSGGTVDQAKTAALDWAQKNGYDATKTTVHIPPASGPYANETPPLHVEVSITTTTPTLFIRVLRINSTTEQGRAVAGFKTTPKNYALIVLDHAACPAYSQSGSSAITINGGGAIVNSSCNPSASQSGGSFVGATYLDYYSSGGWQLGGGATTSVPPSPVSAQLPDPLAALPRPVPCPATGTPPAGCIATSPDSGGTQDVPKQQHISVNNNSLNTLRPGVYWGGLKIDANGNATNAKVTFQPGTYIFAGGGTTQGGFIYSGSAALSGSGVTFFNTGDPLANSSSNQPCGAYSLTGGGVLNFTAPTSGTWKNMLFWQDPACTQTFTYGGGDNTTAGVIYLPTAQLRVTGGGTLGAIQIIVDTLTFAGNAPVSIDYTDYVQAVPPRLALVE
jgi:Flp pilus assembly protein TadG